MTDSETRWSLGLPLELAYWTAWLGTQGRQWADDMDVAHAEFVARFDPTTPLQGRMRELLGTPEGGTCAILDVGAGPATCLGTQWPGRTVIVHAIDPLGNDYNRLLDLYRLIPPVRTYCQAGESLIDERPPSVACFDMAYMRNALDHSIDPMRVVRGMLHVVKPGGIVYLLHHIREADTQQRKGLHQWNFYADPLGFYVMEHALTGDKQFLDAPNMTMTTIGNDVEVVIRK